MGAYVVLSGSLPFFHNVLHKLYRQIVERDLSFPEQAWRSVAKGAQDFILRLLQVRPGDRLSAEQAVIHPWLRSAGNKEGSFGNDWETASQSSLPEPRTRHMRSSIHIKSRKIVGRVFACSKCVRCK